MSQNDNKEISYNPESTTLASTTEAQTPWGNISIKEPDGQYTLPNYASETLATNTTANISQKVGYIEVPLIVRYNIINRRIGFDILGGINTNILVNNNATLDLGGIKGKGQTDDLKTFSGNGIAGIALKYYLTKQLNIGIEPKIKYYYNSLSKNNESQFKPVVFGVYTGISYAF